MYAWLFVLAVPALFGFVSRLLSGRSAAPGGRGLYDLDPVRIYELQDRKFPYSY
jgi:hypothetical protein